MGGSARAPVILLGAACSGTRILRALLAAHPALTAIPWDVNYLWKLGETELLHDELGPGHATAAKRELLERFFARRVRPGTTIVEKTVSNTLRVEFVHALFPDARFVHILRDGRDVAVSARRRWSAFPDLRALLPKLVHFPLQAVPTYGVSYLRAQLPRLLSRRRHVSVWGPMPRGFRERLDGLSLIEACGVQWSDCASRAADSLANNSGIRCRVVHYEQLVRQPVEEVGKILGFLDLDLAPEVREFAVQVRTTAVGAWRNELNREEVDLLLPHVDSALRRFGYLAAS